ncbi:L,D-transpeptidase [Hyphomonas sp.]|uniref:L,D-transpeptidase n=1 Tax=Alphaproteobacteria TaxID=28211 RepID=UPI003265D5BA
MLDRRLFILGLGATMVAPASAVAHSNFKLDPKYQPQRVNYRGQAPGTLVVDPRNRFLYFVEPGGYATRYGVGVGRAGLSLKGVATVGRKAKWPSWTPTKAMIKRSPKQYARYANGVPGGPGNPLGSRALYLYRGGTDTMYRIHGTTQPSSIGRAVSNGCIRMINAHVEQLYERVPVGAKVVIL